MRIGEKVKGIGAILILIGIALAAVIMVQARRAPALGSGQSMQAGEYNILGPFTHKNLTVFLIQGRDSLQGKSFLTLQEAIDQKKVIVHETGNVNQLTIENVSQEEEVYVQSGDIVKGGRQDRVLAFDFIVPPKSGAIPIDSFCVEQSRWQRRGQEEAARFSSSSDIVATKDLKIAAKKQNNQSQVWNKVAEAQEKLSTNVGASANSPVSPSSLQLTLENEKVQKATEDYTKALSSIVDGKQNLIGFAFAINGKVNSADIYASKALFRKLWPKLLKSTAIEAIAELRKESKFEPATAGDVKACLLDAEKGETTEKVITKRVKMVTQETEKSLLFETRDSQKGDAWIHRNYMTK
jgi:hypothetical protein